MRRFFRTTYSLAIIILFVTVALLGFTQTKAFRSYLRTLLIETVAAEVDGELSLGTIEGNLFTGFHVDTVTIRQEGEPVVTVESVEAKYDPLGFLARRIAFSRVVLTNPVFSLTRRPSGSWNLSRLLKAPPADTTHSHWALTFKQIQITGGVLRICDSLRLLQRSSGSSPQVPSGSIDYSDLRIDSLSLLAELNVLPDETNLTVRSLSCSVPRSSFEIQKFSGEAQLTPLRASIRNLDLVTGKTHVKLDARMDGVDITELKDLDQLRAVPVSLQLTADKLDFKELRKFVGNPVDFLEQDISFRADLAGQFGAITVKELSLGTGQTAIRLSGLMTNLHRPGDLELDLDAVENRVDPLDVARMMPTLGIPDLALLGVVDFDLQFKGKPLVFNTRISTSSTLGSVGINGDLDLRDGSLSYNGTVKTSSFNLAPLIGDSTFSSRLRFNIDLQGHGTSLAEMTSVIRAELDSSSFAKLPVGRSVIVVDVADSVIRPRVALRIGSSRIDLGGTLHIQPHSLLSYDLSGRVNSLNLAEITKQRQNESDVSFDIQASGELKTLESLAGTFDVTFLRSLVDTVQFEGGRAFARINTLDEKEHLIRLNSDVADAEVRGHFKLSTVAASLGRAGTLIGEALGHRIGLLDSLRTNVPTEPVSAFRSTLNTLSDSVDYRITLDVKDSFPLGVLLGRLTEGALAGQGRVRESSAGLLLDGTFKTPGFLYGDKGVQFAAEEADISFDVGGLVPERLPQSLELSMDVKAKRFDIEGLPTTNLQFHAEVAADSLTFHVGATIDSLVTIRAGGSGRQKARALSFDLRTLETDFNSYVFENVRPVHLRLGRDGLHIANLLMRHEREEVSLSGFFDPTGHSDISASLYSLQVGSIPRMLRRNTPVEALPAMTGIVSAVGSFKGPFDDPQFALELNASGVRYEREQFGQISLKTSYASRILNVLGQLQAHPDSSSNVPELRVSGTIPYDLTLRKQSDEALEGEINLDVHADRFRLEVLDPFISEIDNLRGLMVCDMKLRGTVASPAYEGSLTLQSAQFLFNPLGIQYVVDGRLVPNGRQIALQNVVVRNITEDRDDGAVNLSGSFSLEGLLIRDFDITVNGQLLVMKESARISTQGLYGDLFAGTGPGGVQWKGSPSRSYATGQVFVKYSNLTLPPVRDVSDLPVSRIDVRFLGQKEPSDSIPVVAAHGRATGLKNGKSTESSVKPSLPLQQLPRPQSKSFLDNIVYNLTVETQGVTQLTFEFNKFTNEQLLADLQGKTTFTKDGDQMRLTGELDLGSRSYYNYFKKLAATGKLRFTGDPLNPELDVIASHEGFHRGAVDTVGNGSPAGSQSISRGSQKVVVKVYITGMREQPKVRMGLERYDALGNLIREERKDVEGDAMAFLVTGTFRDELTQQDRLSLAGSTVLGGMASSILSGPLTDLLRKEFGIVRSIDVLYYGGSFQESADVRLTGELGEAVFRLGGRVLSDLNNTNVSIQLPMSAIVGSDKWRNLVLEAERTVQGVETIDQRRESRGVRLLYRIVF